MWWLYEQLAGNTSALDARCLARQAPGSEWLCLFAENVAPLLTSPVYALQSYYDSYQTTAIANVPNTSAPGAAAAVNAFGALLNARAKASLFGAGAAAHGAALDACHHHCGDDGTVWPAVLFDHNETAQSAAWAAWYARAGGAPLAEQVATFPCDWCCGHRVTAAAPLEEAIGALAGAGRAW
jgi:hypothetical protein